MTDLRHPQADQLAESDPVWVDVPLGPGQVPGIFGAGDLQFTADGDRVRGSDIRRTPGRETAIVVHRPPHAPA